MSEWVKWRAAFPCSFHLFLCSCGISHLGWLSACQLSLQWSEAISYRLHKAYRRDPYSIHSRQCTVSVCPLQKRSVNQNLFVVLWRNNKCAAVLTLRSTVMSFVSINTYKYISVYLKNRAEAYGHHKTTNDNMLCDKRLWSSFTSLRLLCSALWWSQRVTSGSKM